MTTQQGWEEMIRRGEVVKFIIIHPTIYDRKELYLPPSAQWADVIHGIRIKLGPFGNNWGTKGKYSGRKAYVTNETRLEEYFKDQGSERRGHQLVPYEYLRRRNPPLNVGVEVMHFPPHTNGKPIVLTITV